MSVTSNPAKLLILVMHLSVNATMRRHPCHLPSKPAGRRRFVEGKKEPGAHPLPAFGGITRIVGLVPPWQFAQDHIAGKIGKEPLAAVRVLDVTPNYMHIFAGQLFCERCIRLPGQKQKPDLQWFFIGQWWAMVRQSVSERIIQRATQPSGGAVVCAVPTAGREHTHTRTTARTKRARPMRFSLPGSTPGRGRWLRVMTPASRRAPGSL